MAEEPRESSLPVRFVSLLWGVLFLGSGLFKMLMLAPQEELFRRFGLPGWVMVAVGLGEIALGGIILSPRWRPWAALAMAVEMIAAGAAHLVSGVESNMVLANAVLFVGAVWMLIKERSLLLPPPRTPHTT